LNGKPPCILYGYIGDVPVTKPVIGAGDAERAEGTPEPVRDGVGLISSTASSGEPLLFDFGDGDCDRWM